MKTYMPSAKSIDRKWYVVDAEGQTLGRLATVVAATLRGKNKPTFTPFLDTGDYVIVVNADKITVTGKKLDQKTYFSHSKYIGGVKETTLREMLAKKPERVIEHAIIGMLPKGPLGRQMAKKLFVYAGAEHNHQAQKPETLTI
ncbi:MAG: 50S ribosomal protein L13 [Lachnospiraceae bacterium]|nr:50S ribosomal protein L13 [Lachnospiraceae bacterium]